jgi:hypothetical protein
MQILAAIRDLADPASGEPPSRRRFSAATGISAYRIERCFPSWDAAVAAAGLVPRHDGRPLPLARLLADYGRAVREYGGPPSATQFERRVRHCRRGLLRHCGSWEAVPAAFRAFAAQQPPAAWDDVLRLLDAAEQAPARHAWQPSAAAGARAVARPGCGAYGPALGVPGFIRAPVNELGVVMLFARLAPQLGFDILAVQAAFPDCEALREGATGRWQRVRIEFEFESRNFAAHGHPCDGCDLLVCWRHNWPDCPPGLEVLELQSVVQ